MFNRIRGLLGSDLGIDLGTANTLVCVQGEGIVLNEPSIVAVHNGSHRILSGGCAVGVLAKQMVGRTPANIEAVRPLRQGVIADFELCEAMLRYFIRKACKRRWGLRPRVIVAVPTGITPVEKRAVLNSAERAGARQVFLIPEPKAAAIGAGLPIAEPTASMVCDIGGGTTEVAVLSLGDIVASRSLRVAGDEMDRAIVEYLKRHFTLRIGEPMAERLKLEIGSAYPLQRETTAEVRGLDLISGLPRKATITSEALREALSEPLQAIIDAVKTTLEQCDPELAADLVDNGLVLAGGGALLRGIDKLMAEQTGVPVRLADEPATTVARGTAICLEHLSEWRPALESGDEDF
ncbi:MAG: rod shape-determining protein [Pirellulales bacterium]